VDLDRNQRGTWAELLAASWLIQNGHEVFIGFGNTSCDLMAIKDGVVRRVEVKAVSPMKSESGGKVGAVAGCRPDKYDWLLVVHRDGRVTDSVDDIYTGGIPMQAVAPLERRKRPPP
jgi:hypothetical protein